MAITPGVFEGPPPPLKLPHSLTDERGNPFRSRVAATPEYMIAIDEQLALSQHQRAGLEIVDVLYGSWPGRKPRRTWPAQDAILAERPAER